MTPDFDYFTEDKDKELLRRAIAISWNSKNNGNTPFGALLVDKEGNILLEQENIEVSQSDCTGHAETALMRQASKSYSKEFLRSCSLYSSAEPCAMCAGAIYWGNLGRLVYGISEKRLLELTGHDQQNPTLDVPCRSIFEKGQKKIVVLGPVSDRLLEDEAVAPHLGFWDK